jgi:uncharacterized protein YkwD
LAVLVIAMLLAGAADAATSRSLTPPESSLLIAMNKVRRTYGLQPLRADARLERAARGHSS